MSDDKRLNKYLGRLRETKDINKANVYISKIMKYKKMGKAQVGGGKPAEDIGNASKSIDKFMKDFEGMKGKIGAEKELVEKQAKDIKVAVGEAFNAEDLKKNLSGVFTSVKDLIGNVSKLQLGELPNIDNLTQILSEKLKEQRSGETGEKINYDEIIQAVWDEANPQ